MASLTTCLPACESAGGCAHCTDTSAQHQFVIRYLRIDCGPLVPGTESAICKLTLSGARGVKNTPPLKIGVSTAIAPKIVPNLISRRD